MTAATLEPPFDPDPDLEDEEDDSLLCDCHHPGPDGPERCPRPAVLKALVRSLHDSPCSPPQVYLLCDVCAHSWAERSRKEGDVIAFVVL